MNNIDIVQSHAQVYVDNPLVKKTSLHTLTVCMMGHTKQCKGTSVVALTDYTPHLLEFN